MVVEIFSRPWSPQVFYCCYGPDIIVKFADLQFAFLDTVPRGYSSKKTDLRPNKSSHVSGNRPGMCIRIYIFNFKNQRNKQEKQEYKKANEAKE